MPYLFYGIFAMSQEVSLPLDKKDLLQWFIPDIVDQRWEHTNIYCLPLSIGTKSEVLKKVLFPLTEFTWLPSWVISVQKFRQMLLWEEPACIEWYLSVHWSYKSRSHFLNSKHLTWKEGKKQLIHTQIEMDEVLQWYAKATTYSEVP